MINAALLLQMFLCRCSYAAVLLFGCSFIAAAAFNSAVLLKLLFIII